MTRLYCSLAVWAALGVASTGIARPAQAMQFDVATMKDGGVAVDARGEIHTGDLRVLKASIARIPGGRMPVLMVVDSPGGSVSEGVELAEFIRMNRIAVAVPSSSKCASACFLLLAAAPRRAAGTNALVGVHSASIGGRESKDAMATTTAMARIAGSYGVPPAILGKMVQSTPGQMEWLTHDDLLSMGVKIYAESADADDAPAPRVASPAPAPTASPPPTRPAVPQVAAPRPADPQVTVAQFQGALFCGRTSARVTLRVTEASSPARGKAVLNFGPSSSGDAMASGTLVVEGRLDLAGGAIDLRPTAWLSARPADFDMVGLSGQSSDGGKTFSGRATSSRSCTVFTLRRTG